MYICMYTIVVCMVPYIQPAWDPVFKDLVSKQIVWWVTYEKQFVCRETNPYLGHRDESRRTEKNDLT